MRSAVLNVDALASKHNSMALEVLGQRAGAGLKRSPRTGVFKLVANLPYQRRHANHRQPPGAPGDAAPVRAAGRDDSAWSWPSRLRAEAASESLRSTVGPGPGPGGRVEIRVGVLAAEGALAQAQGRVSRSEDHPSVPRNGPWSETYSWYHEIEKAARFNTGGRICRRGACSASTKIAGPSPRWDAFLDGLELVERGIRAEAMNVEELIDLAAALKVRLGALAVGEKEAEGTKPETTGDRSSLASPYYIGICMSAVEVPWIQARGNSSGYHRSLSVGERSRLAEPVESSLPCGRRASRGRYSYETSGRSTRRRRGGGPGLTAHDETTRHPTSSLSGLHRRAGFPRAGLGTASAYQATDRLRKEWRTAFLAASTRIRFEA